MENTMHNSIMAVVEKFRTGNADISELETIAKAEKSNQFPESDYGNAQMLQDMFPNKIRFNHDNGKWYLWDDSFWKPDNTRSVLQFAMRVSRKRQENSVLINDKTERKILEQKTGPQSPGEISRCANLPNHGAATCFVSGTRSSLTRPMATSTGGCTMVWPQATLKEVLAVCT